MSELTRDETAKPVSRDQNCKTRYGYRKNITFLVQLTVMSRIGNHACLIHILSAESSADHTSYCYRIQGIGFGIGFKRYYW